MLKEQDRFYNFETEILRRGGHVRSLATNPETLPIYLTTAFNVEDLDDLQERYKVRGFCYNRSRNPNRTALMELITYLEGGEESIACSSGMGAIATTIVALTASGDHLLVDDTLYGETFEILEKICTKYNVEYTIVDFNDLEQVKSGIRPNTKMLYCETIANPTCTVVNIPELSRIAHENNALLVIDNTFATPVLCRPLDLGADIVINSLTKFASGHSDITAGTATGSGELMKTLQSYLSIMGATCDPITSWMAERGMRTMDLRLKKANETAKKLAAALDASPYVRKVNHPSLPDHPDHALAKSQFMHGGYGAMMSIVLDEDRGKMNAFLHRLDLVHYAMTLGGLRTTVAHPVSSSHEDMPEEDRLKIGITNGMIRISVGLEDPDDLIQDFLQALEVYA